MTEKPDTIVRPDDTEITEGDLRRGMRLNIAAGAMGMVWVATVLGIPLVMLLESLGATGVQIGLSSTLQQLAMLAQLPAAVFAERFASRKKFWAAVVLPHRLLWIVPALLPFLLPGQNARIATLILVVLVVSSILAQAGTASWFSWMTDLIPERASSRFWGRRQSICMAAYLVATLVIGYVLDMFPDPRRPGGSYMGFAIVFSIGVVFGALDILIHLAVPEPRPSPVKAGSSIWHRLLAPLRLADFRWLSFAMGAWAFSVGLSGSFGIIYLKREFGSSYLELSAITIAASIGAILAGFQSGYVIERLGARTYGALLLIIAPAICLVWFFLNDTDLQFVLPYVGEFKVAQPVFLLVLSSVAAGALFSGVGLCQIRLLSALAPSEGRTIAMAVHWTIVGITAALGPLLAGGVVDWFKIHPSAWHIPSGMRFDYIHTLILIQIAVSWFIAAPLLLRVSLRIGDLPIGTALPRLWMGNPMRAVRNVYNIYAITAAVSAKDRADAVRGLGESRTALAVSDLIAKLDDPVYEVREEAAAALGKLDAPEAVAALVAKLQDPQSDIALPAARALRAARSQRSLPGLVNALTKGSSEIQSECARALGAIGHRAAAKPLSDLLGRTNDTKVFVACAEALSRLEERAVIPRLYQAIGTTHNRMLKRSLSITVAELLGTRGEYYKILSREQESRGGEVERLLHQLLDEVTETHRGTAELIKGLERAYEKNKVPEAARYLRDLANLVGGGKTGSVWLSTIAYMATLQTPWGGLGDDQRESSDILLGIYLVTQAVSRRE